MENCHFCMPIIYFATALTFLHEVLRDRNSNFFVTKKYPGLSNNFAPPQRTSNQDDIYAMPVYTAVYGKNFFGKS